MQQNVSLSNHLKYNIYEYTYSVVNNEMTGSWEILSWLVTFCPVL